MSEKRLNNTIFLMFLVSGAYCSAHNLTQEQFLALDKEADDDMMIALRNYWRVLFGPVGSLKAKQTLLEVLEPENLGIQCCLCTPKVVELAVMSMNFVDWRMFA